MENKENRYTLITGASEGIGLELSKLFAMDGNNLILIARQEKKLLDIKNSLMKKYNIDVKILPLDLVVDNSCEKVVEFVDENKLIVDNLVNNVGIGSFGFFHKEKDGFEDKIINLNIVTLTKLTKYFLNKMIALGEGGILNVASTAAFVGGPKMALYYSTKAYVLTLTEAIHDEVKPLGIKVSCLCPGPVKTNFQEKAGIKKSEQAKKYLMNVEDVAREGYRGFLKGKTIIIPGFKNKILVLGTKLLPRALSRRIVLNSNKG